LKNSRLLTLRQECQQNRLAIRELQRIVMGRHPVCVDLPKDRRLVIYDCVAPSEQPMGLAFNLGCKGQLRPGK
jgi:hypothetical protein